MFLSRKNNKELDALMALDHAYGFKLTMKRRLRIIAFPALMTSIFYYIMSQRWWLSIIVAIIVTMIYYAKLMPPEVKLNYQQRSFNARNQLLNVLSLAISDKSKIPLARMQGVVERLSGSINSDSPDYNELKADYATLVAKLVAQQVSRTVAIDEFIFKYRTDLFFVQAFESLRAMLEGQENDDAFRMVVRNHNSLNTNNLAMTRDVNAQKTNFNLVSMICIGVMAFVMYGIVPMIGKADVYKAYINATVGIVATLVVIIIYTFYTLNFFSHYYDRDLTTLGKPKKKKKNKLELTEEEQAEEDAEFMSIGFNRMFLKFITEKERKDMDAMQWNERRCVNFERQRVVMSLSFCMVGGAMGYVITNDPMKAVVVAIVIPVIIYLFTAKLLKTMQRDYNLERDIAFSAFKQRLTPYLTNTNGANPSQVLAKVAGLMPKDDRSLVLQMVRQIEDDSTDKPYVDFAQNMTNDPKAVIIMQAYYSAFRVKDAKATIDSLAEETNQEYMLKVEEIKNIKIGRFGAVPMSVLIIMLVPLFCLLFTYMSYETTLAFSASNIKK